MASSASSPGFPRLSSQKHWCASQKSANSSSACLHKTPSNASSATSHISGVSIIGVRPLPQTIPLCGVVAADDPGAGDFDPANFGQRPGAEFGVPGIAWNDVAI